MRGNVVDLAIAVVIGTAFTALVKAFVADILTPIVAAIFGKPNFGDLTFSINSSQFLYGDLINEAITFVSVAAAIYFFVVVPLNKIAERRARGQVPADETLPPISPCSPRSAISSRAGTAQRRAPEPHGDGHGLTFTARPSCRTISTLPSAARPSSGLSSKTMRSARKPGLTWPIRSVAPMSRAGLMVAVWRADRRDRPAYSSSIELDHRCWQAADVIGRRQVGPAKQGDTSRDGVLDALEMAFCGGVGVSDVRFLETIGTHPGLAPCND